MAVILKADSSPTTRTVVEALAGQWKPHRTKQIGKETLTGPAKSEETYGVGITKRKKRHEQATDEKIRDGRVSE